MRSLLAGAALALIAPTAMPSPTPNGPRPFSADDLVRLERVSDPQLSPDGQQVVYVLRRTDWDNNKGVLDLWLLDLKSGQTRQLTKADGSVYGSKGKLNFSDVRISTTTGTPSLRASSFHSRSEPCSTPSARNLRSTALKPSPRSMTRTCGCRSISCPMRCTSRPPASARGPRRSAASPPRSRRS